MTTLNWKALAGLVNLLVALGVALFLPAWTFHYWQAWAFLAVFGLSVFAITAYLMKRDPALLERRVKAGPVAETRTLQKIVQSLASVAFVAIFVVSALDHRRHWSRVPLPVTIACDALVALGLLIVFLVFRENTFTSAIIEVGADQKVISTGLYSVVRHPMYMGAFLMLLAVPPALGSLWGLFAVIPLMVVIVWRLFDEEKFLAAKLPGYREYQQRVKRRIVPFVW